MQKDNFDHFLKSEENNEKKKTIEIRDYNSLNVPVEIQSL